MSKRTYNLEHILFISIVELENELEFTPHFQIDMLFQKYNLSLEELEFFSMVRKIKNQIRDCLDDKFECLRIVAKEVSCQRNSVDMCIFGSLKKHVPEKKYEKMDFSRRR